MRVRQPRMDRLDAIDRQDIAGRLAAEFVGAARRPDRNEEFFARETGSGTRLAMERLFAEHGIKPRIIMELPMQLRFSRDPKGSLARAQSTCLAQRMVFHDLGRLLAEGACFL